MKKTPAQIADDPTLELSVSLREQIRNMTVCAFKRIPRKIREELGIVVKRSHFLPARAKGVLWKCNKQLMLRDKRTLMTKFENTDVALVPLRIIGDKYQICLSEVTQFKNLVRSWIQVELTDQVFPEAVQNEPQEGQLDE